MFRIVRPCGVSHTVRSVSCCADSMNYYLVIVSQSGDFTAVFGQVGQDILVRLALAQFPVMLLPPAYALLRR